MLKEMGHNTLLKQRNTHAKQLVQDSSVSTVRNLHFSCVQDYPKSISHERLFTSSLKTPLSSSAADASLENMEEKERGQQSEDAREEKCSNHFPSDEDGVPSELGHEGNTEKGKWNSTDDENGDDYDSDNTGDDDTDFSGAVAKDHKQLLLDGDGDDEDDDNDNCNGDDEDNNEYDASTIYEKSETSVSGGERHEHGENDEGDEDRERGSISLDHVTSDLDSELEDESISFMTRESTNVGPSGSLEDDYHDDDTLSLFMDEALNLHQDSWSEEFQQYLDQSPESHAKLQYQVRIILTHAHFILGGRSESAFVDIYNKIFKRSLLSTGFSSAVELCKAMPRVVNRKLLDEEGELHLVESSKNIRVVAGIRSGLRRIVYCILQSHPHGMSSHDFEEEFCNEIGKTLTDVLLDHAYSIPKVECMVCDMLDIVCFRYTGSSQRILLCQHAEDPAWTDGLLIGRIKNTCMNFKENASVVEGSNTWAVSRVSGTNGEFLDNEILNKRVEDNQLLPDTYGNGLPSDIYSSGLPPDTSASEAVIILKDTHEVRDCDGIKDSIASADLERTVCCPEEYILQVRLCLRLLLACWNFGNGIEAKFLQDLYEETFAAKLNLDELGFTSIGELLNCWSDITLLQDEKPGIVCLKPSVENKRIVKTIQTGLRATVFSVLLNNFPDGMDVTSFLQSLNQSFSGNIWLILKQNGYTTDFSGADTFCLEEQHNFQLSRSKALRLLLSDMSDFVRLGCQEDGSLVVKLRGEGFPILDFPDCGLNGFLPDTVWPENLCSVEVNMSMAGQQSHICLIHKQGSKSHNSTPSLSHNHAKLPLQVLKHQIRMILGSPLYMNCGIQFQQLPSIYEARVGQPLVLVEHKDIKSLLCLMPDVASMNPVSGQVLLTKSKQNCRILSVVKSGIRQVLYWSLLKNPGGIWDQLLEGWYTDFVGNSLVTTLSKHGYKISKRSSISSIVTLLEDMCDFVCRHHAEDGLYVLAEDSEDPTSADARLLGMSPSDIQYDPLREHFQSLYSGVEGSAKCSSDILDFLTRKSAVQLNEIDDADSHIGTFKDVLEHSSLKAHTIPGGRQKLEIAIAAKGNVCDHADKKKGEPQEKLTSPKAYISNSIFESESDNDIGYHEENIESETEKKSNFCSEPDQSTASDQEFRTFCKARIVRRDNFQPLRLKVRAHP